MPEHEHAHEAASDHETLYTRSDWDRAVAEGTLTSDHVLDRLRRIAVHEFGIEDPAAYDEDGFFLSLTAEGLHLEGGVTLRVNPRDHLPPHVHVQRPGEIDVRINLESGELLDPVPKGLSSKKLRGFRAAVLESHDLLSDWWEKYHGTPVARAEPSS